MFGSIESTQLYGAEDPVFFSSFRFVVLRHWLNFFFDHWQIPCTLTKFQNVHFSTTLRQGRDASAEGNRFAIGGGGSGNDGGPRFASFQSVHDDTLLCGLTHDDCCCCRCRFLLFTKQWPLAQTHGLYQCIILIFSLFLFFSVRKQQTNKLRMAPVAKKGVQAL